MKKSFIILVSAATLIAACNKEESKSNSGPGNTAPMLVSMTNASSSLAVNAPSYPAEDSIPVHFTQPSDTTVWWICNPSSGSSDTSVYPGDTTSIPVYIPAPVVSQPPPPPPPADTIAIVYPPAGPPPPSPIVIVQPPTAGDTTQGNNLVQIFYSALLPDMTEYYVSRVISNGNLNLKINNPGEYQILVGTYRRNEDGSFTLIRTGFISFFAK